MKQLAKKKIEILNKTFLTVENIQVLMDCGRDKAIKYRQEFIKKHGIDKKYFGNRILTDQFIKYYNLNFDLIKELVLTGGDSDAARA